MPNPPKPRSALHCADRTDDYNAHSPAPTPDDAITARRPIHSLPAGSTAAHHQHTLPAARQQLPLKHIHPTLPVRSKNPFQPLNHADVMPSISLHPYLFSSRHERAERPAGFVSNIIDLVGGLGNSEAPFPALHDRLIQLHARSLARCGMGRQTGAATLSSCGTHENVPLVS